MIDEPLVFDTTCLSHFARAERLDVLHDLVLDHKCMTTDVVRAELRTGLGNFPELSTALEADWLGVARLDTLEALACFAEWIRRMGASERHHGESSVFAAVQLSGGVAITDDRDAVRVGRANNLRVHGTIWLLARACRAGKLPETGAANLIETLRATGMRLPCTGPEFGRYARQYKLL